MRTIILARALWACADVLEIVRDGLIVLASKAVTREPLSPNGAATRKVW